MSEIKECHSRISELIKNILLIKEHYFLEKIIPISVLIEFLSYEHYFHTVFLTKEWVNFGLFQRLLRDMQSSVQSNAFCVFVGAGYATLISPATDCR